MKPDSKSRQLLAKKFSRAQTLHREGALTQARSLYLSILAVEPDHVDALHFLGFLSHQMADSDTALKLIRKSLQLQPSNIPAINNLGNVLLDKGQLEEAEACYRKVIEQQPQEASNFSNLCVALRQQGRLEEAIEAGQTSVRMDPKSAMCWYTLGNAYKLAQRSGEAIDCFQRSVELNPRQPIAHDALCQVTYRLEGKSFLGRRRWKRTIRAYQQWLASDPDQQLAIFMLKALQNGSKLTRVPDEVIRAQFNKAASRFESRLERLEYRVPALMDGALQKHRGRGRGDLVVLDGGCGTGLCAAMLKRYANSLTGVDLSAEMMRHADKLGLYDELIEQELTAFMQAQTDRFDLVLYADTLCYFGDLHDVIAATCGALRRQGMVIFSVEKQSTGSGYQLHPNGRYTHTKNYIEKVLRECGFATLECNGESLRLELGRSVPGLIFVAQR